MNVQIANSEYNIGSSKIVVEIALIAKRIYKIILLHKLHKIKKRVKSCALERKEKLYNVI